MITELTKDQIFNNQIKYMELLSKLGVDLTAFSTYLEANDYFTKPLSATGPYAFEGGLCQYALNLCYELGGLVGAYRDGQYTEQDIIKVALLKDVYRAELYEAYTKNTKNDATGEWESVTAYKYKENRATFGDLNFNSYMVIKHFFELTDEQIEAITQSATRDTFGGDIHDILRSYPLLTLTKMADIAANYLI